MKRILMIFLIFVPFVAIGADLDMRNQMLDREIERLTLQRDEKYEALQKCEKNTKGFKIAGITTLVATGVGVVGNIKLSEKLKGNSGGVQNARVIDNRPQEEKNDDSHNVLCDLDPETAKANGIQC